MKTKTITLYHGTDKIFDEFSNDFLSTTDSIDQYGSGFYFYGVPSKTILHGGLRITANVTYNKKLNYNKSRKGLTGAQIESLILACPDLDDRLSNFGDVDYEGFGKVLRVAVNSHRQLDIVTCLNNIGNAFFSGEDTHLLLSKFVEVTGIDCIYAADRDIYVILTKQQITIQSTEVAE